MTIYQSPPTGEPSVYPGYVPPTPPPYQPQQPSRAPRPRWYRRGWVLGIAGLAVGLTIGAAGSGGTTTKTVAGPTVTTPGPTVTQQVKVPGPTVSQKVTVKVPGPTVTKVVTKKVPAQAPAPAASYSDGTYVVGADIQPGVYKTTGPGSTNILDSCYWARLANLSGDLDSINANDNISGPTTIQLQSGDKALELSGGCTWHKIS